MNTSVINVKVSPDLKIQAQTLAEELGFSLSALINACLKQIVRTRVVSFSASEEPSEYMINALNESRKDVKAGRTISFKSGEKALSYLDKLINNEKKSYRN